MATAFSCYATNVAVVFGRDEVGILFDREFLLPDGVPAFLPKRICYVSKDPFFELAESLPDAAQKRRE